MGKRRSRNRVEAKLLPVKGTTTVEFTPNKSGQLSFSCAMGMYGGMLLVE